MNLEFYNVSTEYCDYLRKYDSNVPYTMDNKANRPFIGVVLNINGNSYFAPLTSPKPKHLKMKNQVDFIKINEGNLGAINLNNMIPVNKDNIKKVDFSLIENSEYKNLLIDQLSWCNKSENKSVIISRASKLYNLLYTNYSENLKHRCCNFKELERLSKLYNKNISNVTIKDKIKQKQDIIDKNKQEKTNIKKNEMRR